MRLIVLGAGAIGGVLAARLHLTGADVVAVARGAHGAAIRERGLRVIGPRDTRVVPLRSVGSLAEIAPSGRDAVLICTKSQDTRSALEEIRAWDDDPAAVVSVQNGIANESMAARIFANVYGCVVAMPAAHLVAGEVVYFSEAAVGCLHLGRYPGSVDGTSAELAAPIASAGFACDPTADFMRLKRAKLLVNLRNALSVVLGPDDLDASLLAAANAEAVAAFRAGGLPYAEPGEYEERVNKNTRYAAIAGYQRSATSSWQSVLRGQQSVEADYLNGEIASIAASVGLAAPVNRAIQRLAWRCARNGSAGTMKPADIWRLAEGGPPAKLEAPGG